MTHTLVEHLGKEFPGQKKGESIKLLIRKHWIIDAKIGLQFFLFFVIPLIGSFWVTGLFWDGVGTDGFYLSVMASCFYFMLVLAYITTHWLNEELDMIIVTNERVIAHDQVDILHRQISETNIAQIQDVKGIEKGFLQSMLRFGSLDIQTAAQKIHFIIKDVSSPEESARILLTIREAYLDKEKFEETPGQLHLNRKPSPIPAHSHPSPEPNPQPSVNPNTQHKTHETSNGTWHSNG
jgi:hypothetical protein